MARNSGKLDPSLAREDTTFEFHYQCQISFNKEKYNHGNTHQT